MSSLIKLASKIVTKHASKTVMSQEQLLQDLHQVHAALKAMEEGQAVQATELVIEEPKIPVLTIKQAFKKDEVICMVCGKGGFKTLTRHLSLVHNLKPGQYRKQFGIKSTQKLAAKSYSEAMVKAAADRGMTAILAKARETRMANLEAKKNLPATRKKASAPAVKVKAPVPTKKVKAAVPAVSE